MSSVSRSEAVIEDEICELQAEEHNVINENPESTPFVVDTSILSSMYTNTGVSIEKLSQNHKVMLLFLRHTGCVFCQEALRDICDLYDVLLQFNTVIVLVHMESAEFFTKYLQGHSNPVIHNYLRVCDKENTFAEAFNVINEFSMAPQNFTRSLGLMLTRGIIPLSISGRDGANISRKPAMFIIENGKVVHQFRHADAHTRPDYMAVLIDPRGQGNASSPSSAVENVALLQESGVYIPSLRQSKVSTPRTPRTPKMEKKPSFKSLVDERPEPPSSARLTAEQKVVAALRDTKQIRFIKLFASRHLIVQNVLFWEQVELKYKKCSEKKRPAMANDILNNFFDQESIFGIQIPNELLSRVKETLEKEGAIETLFDPVIEDMQRKVLKDIYFKFLESDLYTQYMK